MPKKSTNYEEAVKSVQQWNEALKSPTSSIRKTSRPVPAAAAAPRRNQPGAAASPVRKILTQANHKNNADRFRSLNGIEDDNWDNDFASAITPSALKLPHLKPQDHYGGLLSAKNLKAFASFESVTEEAANWDENFEGELTVKSPLQVTATDHLKTFRSISSEGNDSLEMKTTPPAKTPKRIITQVKGRNTQSQPPKMSKKPKVVTKPQSPSTVQYQEDPNEDYSDLVLANDGAFEGKLELNPVSLDGVNGIMH